MVRVYSIGWVLHVEQLHAEVELVLSIASSLVSSCTCWVRLAICSTYTIGVVPLAVCAGFGMNSGACARGAHGALGALYGALGAMGDVLGALCGVLGALGDAFSAFALGVEVLSVSFFCTRGGVIRVFTVYSCSFRLARRTVMNTFPSLCLMLLIRMRRVVPFLIGFMRPLPSRREVRLSLAHCFEPDMSTRTYPSFSQTRTTVARNR